MKRALDWLLGAWQRLKPRIKAFVIFASNPIIVVLVGGAISAFLVPEYANRSADSQRQQDMATFTFQQRILLIRDISDSAAKVGDLDANLKLLQLYINAHAYDLRLDENGITLAYLLNQREPRLQVYLSARSDYEGAVGRARALLPQMRGDFNDLDSLWLKLDGLNTKTFVFNKANSPTPDKVNKMVDKYSGDIMRRETSFERKAVDVAAQIRSSALYVG